MRGRTLLVLVMVFLTLSFAGVSDAWQGRMAGMGDPFGLVKDESDFLIHPSEIAEGKGVNFYGNYRFNWQDVTGWNYTMKQFFIPTGTLLNQLSFRTSGDVQKHDGLAGAALPLGPGRLGLFFQYTSEDGDFRGSERNLGLQGRYTFNDDLDAFALRVLYGLPLGSFKFGTEVQLGYQEAKNADTFVIGASQVFHNDIIGAAFPFVNTFPFQLPYDSNWWEMLFKGSLEGSLGPGKLSLTGRGGFIFDGDNDLQYGNVLAPIPVVLEAINFKGDVTGWKAGGDLWWGMPLRNGLSLPLLVRVDYSEKMWNGKGLLVPFGSMPIKYKSEERDFRLEAGGGLDKDLGNGARIASGVYYNYLESDRSFFYQMMTLKTDHTDYPLQKEHRISLRVAGEKEWCPTFTGRLGLNFFYGWVDESYRFRRTAGGAGFAEHISMDGYHWGAVASLGGTVKFSGIAVEPFVNGGYQKLSVDGDRGFSGTFIGLSMDKLKQEWSVGAGLSIRY